MHHFGGGYSDIKLTGYNWLPAFSALENSDADGAGYTELGPGCVAVHPSSDGPALRAAYKKLIGNAAFLFKKRSSFTTEWFKRVNNTLDEKMDLLKENPSRHPQDVLEMQFSDGTVSKYPLRWAEIQGEIFHQLTFERMDSVIHVDIVPLLHSYR